MVAIAIMVFGVACAGLSAAYAATDSGKSDPMSGLVSAIAQKFNLSEADVQTVFDEQRTKMEAEQEANRAQMEAEHQAKFETKLSELVTAGKLTQAQANAIKAKKAELQAKMESAKQTRRTQMQNMKNMTQEQRKAAMEARKTEMETQRTALQQWAKDNGISEEYMYLVNMGGGLGMGGHGRGGGFGGSGPCAEGSGAYAN